MKDLSNEYGETWTEIPNGDIVTRVTRCLEGCEWSGLQLDFVAKVEGFEHKVIHLWGGRNGSGEWNKYLVDMLSFINKLKDESIGQFKNAYVISLKNDCADDVFSLYIGVREK